MGLLSKLKSMLGLESSERPPGSGVDVTVEREPDADDATDADSESAAADAATEPTDAEESPAEDADSETDDSEYVTTDADVGTDAGDDADDDDDDTESADAAESEAEPEAEPEPDDLTAIKGVGPAYADRLNDAGITTFAALADADADELAAATDLSPKRVGRWIDRAADR